MKQFNKIFLLIITAQLVSACGINSTRTGNPSKAMQLAMAASIDKGLYDLPSDKLDQYMLHESSNLPYGILALGYEMKLFRAPFGFSSVGARNMSALQFLARDINDAYSSHIIAWLPSNLANSKEKAISLYTDELKNAAQKALPEGYESKWVTKSHTTTLTRITWTDSYFEVNGPRCKNWSCRIMIKIHDQTCISDKIYCIRKDSAPAIIGNYPSYRIRGNVIFSRVDDNNKAKPRLLGSPTNHPEFTLNLSKNLPSWVYYYVAPISSSTRIPMFLNKGKPIFFQTQVSTNK